MLVVEFHEEPLTIGQEVAVEDLVVPDLVEHPGHIKFVEEFPGAIVSELLDYFVTLIVSTSAIPFEDRV